MHRHGDCKVPTFYKNDKPLGKWVARQREDNNDGVLQPERKKKLDELGFVWQLKKKCDPIKRNTAKIDERWNSHYKKLVKFTEEYGHPNVPDDWEGDKTLSKWVKGQRVIFNRNLMPKDRLKKLQDIGFVFGFQAQKKQQNWNRMYELLKMCQTEDGVFTVSMVGDDAPSLSRWIQRQREAYRTGKMEPGREILLRKLNFHLPDKQLPEQYELPEGEIGANSTTYTDERSPAAAAFQGVLADGRGVLTAAGTTAYVAQGQHTGDGFEESFRPGTNIGKLVSDSILVLAKYLNVTPDEVSARMSAPSITPPMAAAQNVDGNGSSKTNIFGRLMPLIVRLRSTVDRLDLDDCCNFLSRLVWEEKGTGYRDADEQNSGHDSYSRLLALAVELNQILDVTLDRSEAVVQSCEAYFEHVIMEKGRLKRSAETITEMASPQKQSRV